MKTSDFTTTLLVGQPAKTVFDCINQPELWWSGQVEGSASQPNDEFTYRYQDFHYSRQRVLEMIPDQKVVWLVTESSINFVENKNEWTGTRITFEISQEGKQTRLLFSHLGLVPDIACFDSCSNAWSQLIHQSLGALITTGEVKHLVLA